MSLGERLGAAAAAADRPETAHRLALAALRAGLGPRRPPVTSPRLATTARRPRARQPARARGRLRQERRGGRRRCSAAGFGFVEVGAATPLPQPGNPRPRLFRLAEDRAVINRFGFNNDGVAAIAARLAARPPGGVVGLNLGANKASPDRAADYAAVLAHGRAVIDFATVNVSSPNTERLRDLQGGAALRGAPRRRRRPPTAALARPVPLFLKIAPDLDRPRARRAGRGGARRRHRRHRRHQHHAGPRRLAEPARRRGRRAFGARRSSPARRASSPASTR